MTLDPSLDYYANKGVLPDFVSPASILKKALPALDAGDDLTVTQCAEKYRVVDSKAYDRTIAPYMVEPQNMTTSRKYRAVIYCGSVQSSKTFGLIENVMLHRIMCDAGLVHITQMDRVAAGRYSKERIESMLLSSPKMKQKLNARGESLGNVFEKHFDGPMTVSVGWPVKSQLASRSIPTMLTTDRDRISDDIDGEGDILTMMLARNKTAMSRGMSVVESSPGRNVLEVDWEPKTIHEAPPVAGVLGNYNQGTRGRYYWKCPHCKGKFAPDYKNLRYGDEGSHLDRAQTVYMLCPLDKCGGIIEPGKKHFLNQLENGAGWLHESKCGKKAVPINHKNVRKTEYVSYWQMGVIAAFQTWADMVSAYLAAEEVFENREDEAELKAVTNTILAHPFSSKKNADSNSLTGAGLKDRAQYRDLGTAPSETHFIIISVDVQPNRFVISEMAYGRDLECWLVDRYDLFKPPVNSPNAENRILATNVYEEDWELLNDLHDKLIPIVGDDGEPTHGLKPSVVIVDSNGKAGTTKLAYKFWRKKFKARQTGVYYLYKGASQPNAKRAVKRKPDNQGGRKSANRLVPDIVFANTNLLKDDVMVGLLREDAGPNAFHLTDRLPMNIYEEFTAEQRDEDGKWDKKPGKTRNESLDLAVMASAGVIIRGGEKVNWDKPPVWAKQGMENSFAFEIGPDGKAIQKSKKSGGGAALAKARANLLKNKRG